MRFVTLIGVIVLAVSLRPARAAGQEAPPAVQPSAALETRIDPRLLIAGEDRRAAVDRADQRRVELNAAEWSLLDHVRWGMGIGALISVAYIAVTADEELAGRGRVLKGALGGAAVGAGVGGLVYVIRRL